MKAEHKLSGAGESPGRLLGPTPRFPLSRSGAGPEHLHFSHVFQVVFGEAAGRASFIGVLPVGVLIICCHHF